MKFFGIITAVYTENDLYTILKFRVIFRRCSMYGNRKNLVLKDEKSIFIDETVFIGDNVTIYENTRIEGKCKICDGAVIYPGCFIKDSIIGEHSTVDASRLDGAVVEADASVGPYARLRPGARIGKGARIGNFVEIKNASIGEGTKVSHLAYVGDADVGRFCNVGCGAIFVNYDGRSKHRTTVGDNSFIGSNCNVIAPVNIGKNSYIVAGTTVTSDVSEDDFVIGRVRQENKPRRAHDYLKEMM